MLLVIDIGNSSTKFGVFQGGRLVRKWSMGTRDLPKWKPSAELRDLPAMVASVVPQMEPFIDKIFKNARFIKISDIPELKIGFKKKREIGADRIVDAYAAFKRYGAPAIVIDFGTATTFDVISLKGEYLGGAIAPGIGLSREVLHTTTAKLPLVTIKPPKKIIGSSTAEAMRSGLVFGYAAMVEGMIQRIKSEIRIPRSGSRDPRSGIKVIATGGYAKLIAKYTRGIDIIDADLTLKGLYLLWRKN
ncbi:MAG TPA: type III pantothenate kinase [Candidatus Omnitrophota bacterium]|nr:type III pantothenate kinase [Candidatus Omnitrophota bacterium]